MNFNIMFVWSDGELEGRRCTADGEARRLAHGLNECVERLGGTRRILQAWRNNQGQLVQIFPLPQDRT